MDVKPSRTYNLAKYGILAELVLALMMLLVAILRPDALADASPTLLACAGGIGAAAGIGSGAMGYRDGASGGWTTSQAPEGFAPGIDILTNEPPVKGTGGAE